MKFCRSHFIMHFSEGKFVYPIDEKSSLVQVKAWHWTGNKALSEPVMTLFAHVIWHHLARMSSHPLEPYYIITMMSSWARWRLKSPAFRLFTQPFVLAQIIVLVQIKENIRAPCHWSLWGKFTVDWWIPHTMMSSCLVRSYQMYHDALSIYD